MKVGDIVLNKFGGIPHNRILVYVGNNEFIYLLSDNTFAKGRWDKKTKFHDGTPNLEVIGHTNFIDILKNDILKYQELKGEISNIWK